MIMTIINVAAHGVFKVQKTFQVHKYYPIQIAPTKPFPPLTKFYLFLTATGDTHTLYKLACRKVKPNLGALSSLHYPHLSQ